MRPSQFLLSLLPLIGCGLASSQQYGQSEQSLPSTGVDPIELLTAFNGLASTSRNMRLKLRAVNKNTAAEMGRDLLGDIMTETYILLTYGDRLADTSPFLPGQEGIPLGIGFVKWKRDTSDFLMRLGKSSGTFRKNSPDLTLLETNLISFKKQADYFCRMFHAVNPNLDSQIGWLERYMTGRASNLPAIFEHTIRDFANKTHTV